MNMKIVYLILLILLNALLYLSLNFYLNLSYLILTILISINFYTLFEFYKLKKKNNLDLGVGATADDHPIIKAAKQRLNK
tara:strand:- start:328 stop:567 length:240 start_codon:yes stop_codon:yes gene_type:complete